MKALRRALLVALAALVVAPAAFAAAGAARAPDACAGALPVSAEALMLDGGSEEAGVLTACVGKIQPGASMSWCTYNWVVRDETGALYIGTAGHCVWGVGQRMPALGVGEFGTVAYAINAGIGRDFALVKIDPEFYDRVDPTLCHWGGPTGVASYTPGADLHDAGPFPAWFGGALKGMGGSESAPALLHYGWGLYTRDRDETRPRVGAMAAATASSLWMAGNYNPGDSGSPVMFADGNVAGVVTHSALVNPPPVGVGLPEDDPFFAADYPPFGGGAGFGTRFDHALALAGAATGRTFTLVTSESPVLLTALGELP